MVQKGDVDAAGEIIVNSSVFFIPIKCMISSVVSMNESSINVRRRYFIKQYMGDDMTVCIAKMRLHDTHTHTPSGSPQSIQ